MAITQVQKIQLVAVSEHRNKILDKLQNFGALHITEISEESDIANESSPQHNKDIHDAQKVELDHANTTYAIGLLSPYGAKRGIFQGPITLTENDLREKVKDFDLANLIQNCQAVDDKLTKAKNELMVLHSEKGIYTPWKNLKIKVKNLTDTKTTKVTVGIFKSQTFEEAKKALEDASNLISIDIVDKDERNTYTAIIFDKNSEKSVKQILSEQKFTEAELPEKNGLIKDYLKTVEEKISTNEKLIKEQEKELTTLAKQLDDLKIVHDYLKWQKDKADTTRKLGNTQYSFVINGWIPKNKRKELEETLEKDTNEFCITEIQPEENESPPVVIQNSKTLWPFETLTRMYGLPRHDELDPTPYLSVFFVLFFALCLTDAAYGLIMFIITALALKYMKLGEGIKRLVKLLMYGGIATFFIGALFGGWFGLEATAMPDFLTYTSEAGEKMFLFQIINSVTNPLTVLILALALGFSQILFGTYLKLFHDYKHGNKKDAILDTGAWAFMLTAIGLFVLAAAGVLPEALKEVTKWLVYIATASIILTQGRDKKNIILKLLSGVLSLYGLVSYMSDILSYSRLLALGLATTIIGLAVNVIVNLAMGIPYIGWLFAIVIFVGGHVFNMVINTLGSFIHSGRLQFVEFFSKFMEGGGKDFEPFEKKNKYIFIKN